MKTRFDFSNWRGDFSGGLTAGIVALPLALAFGVQSGLGAVAGVYGAITLGVFSSLFGGTKTQISGPTGPMTVVAIMVVLHSVERTGSLEAALPLVLATFMLAGALQVVFGLVRFGNAVKFIPYPVISGFMTGIAIITVLIQLFPAMGLTGPKMFIDIIMEFPAAISQANLTAVWMTLVTVGIVYLVPKFSKKVPSSLFALIVLTMLAHIMDLNIPVIGDIPQGLPDFHLGAILGISLKDIIFILVPAITLALLGCVDSLLTSVIVDNISKTRHDSNQELVGQGIGNMMSAIIGGLPGAGTTMTSVINTTTGARTRLGGAVHGVFLLAVLLGVGQYAEHIPLAVLAGILITIGFNIVDYKGLKDLFKIPRSEAMVLVTVMLMTVFVDLIKAVAVGMVLATFIFMKKIAEVGERETKMSPLAEFASNQGEKPFGATFNIPEEMTGKVYVESVKGPLFFGLAGKLLERIDSLGDVKLLIFDLGRVHYIDQTGVYALEEIITRLREKGIDVMFINVHNEPLGLFKKLHVVPQLVPEQRCFLQNQPVAMAS
ncbi:MAG: SulP family inorganic anion transporter [Candidatus Nitronauta litoralis]|uniref:SulP family inorganic anion transporter n=1 Tax=Candidatus Nitronauta litoralis TaxID=2705533 RepID=A0A7T0BXR2_9BACT|nr:MAG: SulP family inorganic anion transporter [Candidatus Nitronauta litoralis]